MLAFDEGTPVGEQDGGRERIGGPEELARPILRFDRFAQEFVDDTRVPDVADRCRSRNGPPSELSLCPYGSG